MNYKIPKELLSKGTSNAKTSKNEQDTYILYLAPYNQNSKKINICPKASSGCAAACLFTAGRGAFSNVIKARQNKTEYYLHDKKAFIKQLVFEIRKEIKKASDKNEKIAFRLNGTSDIDFLYLMSKYENFDVNLLQYDKVYFYDYTKSYARAKRYKESRKYTLTFSKSESNLKECDQIRFLGGVNIAVVFKNDLPKKYKNIKVIDGDKSDLEMLKYKGVIIGLRAKGDAKKDTSGFVVTNY